MQNPVVSRAMVPPKPLGEDPPFFPPAAGAQAFLHPISVSAITQLLPVCFCLLIRTPVKLDESPFSTVISS